LLRVENSQSIDLAELRLFFHNIQAFGGCVLGLDRCLDRPRVCLDCTQGVGDILECRDDCAAILRLGLVKGRFGRFLFVVQGETVEDCLRHARSEEIGKGWRREEVGKFGYARGQIRGQIDHRLAIGDGYADGSARQVQIASAAFASGRCSTNFDGIAVWDLSKGLAAEKRVVEKRGGRKNAGQPLSSKTRKASVNLPDFVPPQLCESVARPPNGPGWVREIKFDGYRIQLGVEAGRVSLKTRKGLDWTVKFGAIAEAAGGLPDGIIDGEIVASAGQHRCQPGNIIGRTSTRRKAWGAPGAAPESAKGGHRLMAGQRMPYGREARARRERLVNGQIGS
jgi:ATP dependent DNA ligase domain